MPDETNKGEVPTGETEDANKVCIAVNGGSGQTAGRLPAVYECPSCSFVASREKMLDFYHPTVMVARDTLPNYSAQAGKLAPQK